MSAKLDTSARPRSTASSIACVGVCGYLVGLALPLYPTFDVPLAFLVVLATLAAVTGLKQPKISWSVAVIPVLGFVMARLVSAMAAAHVSCGPQLCPQLMVPFLPALLLFVLLSEWVETPRQITAIYVSLAGVSSVLATTLLIVSSVSDTSDADAWAHAVPSPMLVVKNDITVVAVLAPLTLALAFLQPRRMVRLGVLGFFGLLIAVIVVVQSRTALLTTVVSVACFTALARRTFAIGGRLLLLPVGVVAVAFAVDTVLGFRFFHKTMHEWQGNGRLALWAGALGMFHDAPLLGHGPNSYALHYRAYLDALQLPSWVRVDRRVTPWAHNLYLELLAEQGILGLACFLAMCALGLVMVSRINRSRQADLKWLGAGAGAALLAFLTAAAFELSFLRVWVIVIVFTLLGLLSAIARCAKHP